METSIDESMGREEGLKGYMKSAQSTSSIPTFRGYGSSSILGSGHDPGKGKYKSVCSGLDENRSSTSKKVTGLSSSRPSSIPRLIPLTEAQKKGLLRSVITRNLGENKSTNENCRPNDEDGCQDGAAAKRPRLTRPSLAAGSRLTATSSSATVSSVGAASGVAEVSQAGPYENVSMADQRNYELQTVSLRDQIAKFFGTAPGAVGKPCKLDPLIPSSDYYDPVQKTVEIYVMEIFTRQLESEALYYSRPPTKELERQLAKRAEIVNWILKAGVALKLIYQTLHVATYIVDAFLRVQPIPNYALELCGAAALFIAAKQEETDFMLPVESLLKQCSVSHRYTPVRLTGMEAKILNKLKFKICCPTSLFFMEACASQMTYSDQYIKKFTLELAQCILFHALGETELMFCSNSKKARLALHYSVKYVCYNYDLLMIIYGKEKHVWDRFRIKCFPEFRTAALNGVSLPKSLSSSNPSPKIALRDMTNKGCRPTQLKNSGAILSDSRTTRVK